jgi:hypothetical protein
MSVIEKLIDELRARLARLTPCDFATTTPSAGLWLVRVELRAPQSWPGINIDGWYHWQEAEWDADEQKWFSSLDQSEIEEKVTHFMAIPEVATNPNAFTAILKYAPTADPAAFASIAAAEVRERVSGYDDAQKADLEARGRATISTADEKIFPPKK